MWQRELSLESCVWQLPPTADKHTRLANAGFAPTSKCPCYLHTNYHPSALSSQVYIVVKSTNVMLGGRNGEQEKAEGKLAAPQPVRVPSPQIQREDSRPCLFN